MSQSIIDLRAGAAELPQAWRSRVAARFGGANLKLLRMDGQAYPGETHDYDEGLLVVDGELRLTVDGMPVQVKAGELCVMPAGVPHAVAAGSYGVLLIFDPEAAT